MDTHSALLLGSIAMLSAIGQHSGTLSGQVTP
jgi:hypothetical protein